MTRDELAARRSLLAATAHLQRAHIALELHAVREHGMTLALWGRQGALVATTLLLVAGAAMGGRATAKRPGHAFGDRTVPLLRGLAQAWALWRSLRPPSAKAGRQV